MEMLNQQTISTTPVQHHHQNTDIGSIGNYVQQQRQQPTPQMSGPYRPSNGSNILEQHAMRPATTADPSNCVFNDQESPINVGMSQSNSIQMQQQNMMGNSKTPIQHQHHSNQMGNSTRLPSLTLNTSYGAIQTQSSISNGMQHQQQMQQSSLQIDGSQGSMGAQYNQTAICQKKVPVKDQQMFSQQSMNSQQMNVPPRMNTPVSNHQNMGHQQQQHNTFVNQQSQQQTGMIQQRSNTNQIQMGQSQQHHNGSNSRMVSTFQINQTSSEQVSHLSHMDLPPPTQHSMNSISQPQIQQHSNSTLNSNSVGVQSPATNTSSNNSPSRLPPLTFGNAISHINNNQNNIPMNANSTTQLLMALNSNSPMTSEQLQEIQSMTCTAPDGNEILLMQEPRLKQYSSLKDMSTNDLRSECKKRQMTSTGTKVKLCERLSSFEVSVLEERNTQLLKEFSHRQQMYEAQAATMKAINAKKATQQGQGGAQAKGFGSQAVSSSEITSTTQNMNQSIDGPPAKKKRVSKPKKSQQQQEKQKGQINSAVVSTTSNGKASMPQRTASTFNSNSNSDQMNNSTLGGDIMSLLGNKTNSSIGVNNMSNHMNQNSTPNNMFSNMNQPDSGFYMNDMSCFSHLGSGCSLISTSNNNADDNQSNLFVGRSGFQAVVPPPPEDSQVSFQQHDHQNFGFSEQMGQSRTDTQNRPMNLNQQQPIGNHNIDNHNQEGISRMFNVPMQQQQMSDQLMQQPQQQQQQQQNYVNNGNQTGLQGSPCTADQAGPSPNMPVSDPTATTSGSPVLASSVENPDTAAAELMDIETMQKLLSPATLRAREELLTQQQSRINELVKLIQKNHDTLREQQMQINLAKKQQKLRQRQNVPPAASLDKQVNSRCLQMAIKNRHNLQMLNELTKQQDSIRTAETRLIEQLHINTATDDIARLIKQDGRTALVIVSLLHDYRTTREQNNRSKTTTSDASVTDNVVEVVKKKAAPRKRNNNGSKVTQNKKNTKQQPPKQEPQIQQQQPEIEVVQVISPEQQPKNQQFLEFPQPLVPPRSQNQSDVDMEAIFKTVIDASRTTLNSKNKESQKGKQQQQQQQKPQQQIDHEIISLPSEVSSPSRTQSQNSAQSVYSENFNSSMMFHSSPQQEMSYCGVYNNGSVSSCSPEVIQTPNEMLQQHVQSVISKQDVELLPQLDRNGIEQDLESKQFFDAMMFNEDSNQEYVDQNNQANSLDFEFPDIDQMVANIRESDPLSCPLDDIDLTAILNSWTDNCDTKQETNEQSMGQEVNGMCDNMMFDQGGSMDQMDHLHDDLDWNDYQSNNIINQAFEQSQIQ